MERCLDENEIAQYADCLIGFDLAELLEDVLNHVQNCERCKTDILEAVEIILVLMTD